METQIGKRAVSLVAGMAVFSALEPSFSLLVVNAQESCTKLVHERLSGLLHVLRDCAVYLMVFMVRPDSQHGPSYGGISNNDGGGPSQAQVRFSDRSGMHCLLVRLPLQHHTISFYKRNVLEAWKGCGTDGLVVSLGG